MNPLRGLCDRNAVHDAHDFLDKGRLWYCVGQDAKHLPVWDSGRGYAATNIAFFIEALPTFRSKMRGER